MLGFNPKSIEKISATFDVNWLLFADPPNKSKFNEPLLLLCLTYTCGPLMSKISNAFVICVVYDWFSVLSTKSKMSFAYFLLLSTKTGDLGCYTFLAGDGYWKASNIDWYGFCCYGFDSILLAGILTSVLFLVVLTVSSLIISDANSAIKNVSGFLFLCKSLYLLYVWTIKNNIL